MTLIAIFFIQNQEVLNNLNFSTFNDDVALLTEICQNSLYMKIMLYLILFSIIGLLHITNISATIFYIIANFILKHKNKLIRTKEGNLLTEKIYGLKNFIKDFSNLSEATKKELVLWDEFLIYAIILEENTKILEEISNYSNKNLLKYKNSK